MSSLNQVKPTKQIPSNLSQPCPDLQLLDANTGKAWLPWSIDTVNKYNDCKLRHDAIIKSSLTIYSSKYVHRFFQLHLVLHDMHRLSSFESQESHLDQPQLVQDGLQYRLKTKNHSQQSL